MASPKRSWPAAQGKRPTVWSRNPATSTPTERTHLVAEVHFKYGCSVAEQQATPVLCVCGETVSVADWRDHLRDNGIDPNRVKSRVPPALDTRDDRTKETGVRARAASAATRRSKAKKGC